MTSHLFQTIDAQLSSATVLGGLKSDNGAAVTIPLDPPISVPGNAISATLECLSSDIWFTSPNIEIGVRDRLWITAPGPDWDCVSSGLVGPTLQWVPTQPDLVTPIPFVSQEIIIPPGLYNITTLNETLYRQQSLYFCKNTAGQYPVALAANTATGGSFIDLKLGFTVVDFIQATDTESVRHVLGYDPEILSQDGLTVGSIGYINYNRLVPATLEFVTDLTPIYFEGGQESEFNHVNGFLVHCDLVNAGIRLNDTWSQIIQAVPIQVEPGSMNQYEPRNPAVVPAHNLIGQTKSAVRVWITNENNEHVTFSDDFIIRIRISYLEPRQR